MSDVRNNRHRFKITCRLFLLPLEGIELSKFDRDLLHECTCCVLFIDHHGLPDYTDDPVFMVQPAIVRIVTLRKQESYSNRSTGPRFSQDEAGCNPGVRRQVGDYEPGSHPLGVRSVCEHLETFPLTACASA